MVQDSKLLREAVPIYEALDMPGTREFRAPEDGVKVRCC